MQDAASKGLGPPRPPPGQAKSFWGAAVGDSSSEVNESVECISGASVPGRLYLDLVPRPSDPLRGPGYRDRRSPSVHRPTGSQGQGSEPVDTGKDDATEAAPPLLAGGFPCFHGNPCLCVGIATCAERRDAQRQTVRMDAAMQMLFHRKGLCKPDGM